MHKYLIGVVLVFFNPKLILFPVMKPNAEPNVNIAFKTTYMDPPRLQDI